MNMKIKNSNNSEILEQGLRNFLIFGLMLILFFIIGMFLYNLRELIISII